MEDEDFVVSKMQNKVFPDAAPISSFSQKGVLLAPQNKHIKLIFSALHRFKFLLHRVILNLLLRDLLLFDMQM